MCGSRTWTDRTAVHDYLDQMYERHVEVRPPDHRCPFVVIEGGARGADAFADGWTRLQRPSEWWPVTHLQFPALWDKHGRAAGPIRNAQMLSEGRPSVVAAFAHDLATSKGTNHMVKLARAAGIRVDLVGAR